MAGAMRKMGVYLGLVEDDDRYDDDDYDEYDEYADGRRSCRSAGSPAGRGCGGRRARAPALPAAARGLPRAGATGDDARRADQLTGSPRCTRAPTTRPGTIGEHFREGTPVIMNLTDMDDTDAKRLVDFAAG